MIEVSRVKIPTDTPYDIGATIRYPNSPKGVILFNSGTCIQRGFYDDIAVFFSEHGYATIQYDYIGVGESKPADLSQVDRSIYDWGSKDIEVMSTYIDSNYPLADGPKYIIGHSMGGQLVGLTPSISSFKKIITIASSYGNYRNFITTHKWASLLGAKLIFPLLTYAFGYLPGRRMGFGEDWPAGVVRDWIHWNSAYLSLRQWMEKLGKEHHFLAEFPPMTSYVMSDDIMATPKCIPHFKIDFPHAQIHVVEPSSYGLEEMGHFKTFKPQSLAFWKDVLIELERG